MPLVSEEDAQKIGTLSQRDYEASPYRDAAWEVVSSSKNGGDFRPLEMPLLASGAGPDPMFEVFSTPLGGSGSVTHGGERQEQGGSESSAPSVLDLAEVEAELERRYTEGTQRGYEAGLEEGRAAVVERYERLEAELQRFQEDVNTELRAFFKRVDQQSLELSLQIAQKILHTTVDLRPDYIVEIIREALRGLGSAKPLRIRVSPSDYEFISVIGLPSELSSDELGVEYVSDDSVKAGCIVETDFGHLDHQVDTMWEQLRENLYEVAK